ncbi:MAG: modification methylase [Anaerolineae bacterium]|nr:modification methylase [Anaerolineae bacterium]
MKIYSNTRTPQYDFKGQSYASQYPNLHRYPATMLPQIGIALLDEFGLHGKTLLDPYCGSGSSLIAGLHHQFDNLYGYDLNPLAILICKAKFTPVKVDDITQQKRQFKHLLEQTHDTDVTIPQFTNIHYWFSERVLYQLGRIKSALDQMCDSPLQYLLWVAFSETIRACSYVRQDEFKLYRIPKEKLANFTPDVENIFYANLSQILRLYEYVYLPKLRGNVQICLENNPFTANNKEFDVILTSPPYGDSQTTVAYGQFSLFTNEWLGFKDARQLDKMMMGGKPDKTLYVDSVISEAIQAIYLESPKRAFEVSAFYRDLAQSIDNVSKAVKISGYVIYIVGNRRVKNIPIPTDQFIAEQFEHHGLKHIITYERLLSNKVMPSKNSPSNRKGETVNTMLGEYIVICQKG